MSDPSVANLAFQQVWSIYRLMNADVGPDDARRASLERFIKNACQAGQQDLENLVVAGLKYLKMLDGRGDRYSTYDAF
jgi:hypothetical protein